jgi:hypothetical protein
VEITTHTIFGEWIAHRRPILDSGVGFMPRSGDDTVSRPTFALYDLGNVCFIVLTEINDAIHAANEVMQVGTLDERCLITVSHRKVNQ